MQLCRTAILFLFSCTVFASSQEEINHLIKYVENTKCQYERNGKMHTGTEAVEHIQKKYQYFAKKVKTAEDFINYSATKSTMSRKPYLVHCEGQESLKSQDWLMAELTAFRKIKDTN